MQIHIFGLDRVKVPAVFRLRRLWINDLTQADVINNRPNPVGLAQTAQLNLRRTCTQFQFNNEVLKPGFVRVNFRDQATINVNGKTIRVGIRSGFGDDWIRIGAVKIFSDGALGARTALMVEPYEGEPDNYGIAVATAEHLDSQVEKAARNGLAVHIHAIGDQANRNVLNAVEKTRKAGIGLQLRHRIEHAQILHPDDVSRFAKLGVIPGMQPIHCTQDIVYADANWGERSRLAYA